jgi:hypothetical protein
MKTFHDLKLALNIQFDVIKDQNLFVSKADKNELKQMYLSSFPEGSNPIFVTNTEHDCNCCMQYIRSVGNVLAIVDYKLVSVWDIEIGGHYQVVADAMSALVKSKGIDGLFLHHETNAGQEITHSLTDGVSKTWNHFHQKLPGKCVSDITDMPTKLAKVKDSYSTLKRGLSELTIDAMNVVLELIAQNSLYRGEEHKGSITAFVSLKNSYDATNNKDLFLWECAITFSNLSGFRNSAIGTLVTDLSDGIPLEKAVKSFENKVAPANYKRPKSLITQSMIKNAEAKVAELGIADSLQRRYAQIDDITINNVLFADRTAKVSMGVFGDLRSDVADKLPNLDKVEEVSIDTFLTKILPTSKSIEVFFANELQSSLVSLIAPENKEANSILKWGNNFTWSYNGEVADSMRERVTAAGGRVDGVLRFTNSWNHNGGNSSLMDLHVFMPGCGYKPSGKKQVNDLYPNTPRVGWNHRQDFSSGGVQDVDYTSQAPKEYIPVENITFPDLYKMPDDVYYMKIHNWDKRDRNTEGFKAEIEFDGQLYQYTYKTPLQHKEWVDVAEVTKKGKTFSIVHKLPQSVESVKIWDISTEKFHKVKVMMQSPNHWDGEETGNKHYFFMLDDCSNPLSTRGFYNEFLNQELNDHRKVFEVLASKMKVEHSDKQLSGLGFSSTQKNSLLCRVEGSFNRLIKIKF